MNQIKVKTKDIPTSFNDNEAMIDFVKGDSVAKGVRHMEMRMWYTREKYEKMKSSWNI